jgi:CRP/FNR family transcriptional regulator
VDTTQAIGTPKASIALHVHPAQMRAAAQPIPNNVVTPRLQQALTQIEDLKRALMASQQESIAAHEKLDILARANAQHTEFTDRREHEVARSAPQGAIWRLTDSWLATRLKPHMRLDIEQLSTKRIRLRNRDVLYRIGDWFTAVYAIHAGSCKMVLFAKGGQEQVVGYHMAGEIVGIDGIGSDFHECQAIALEDMEVYRLPRDQIENPPRFSDQFGHNLHKLLSQANTRAYTQMLVLVTMRAEQRLAMFLLDLSRRYQARGYSSSEFILRMTREEIGSYLGLKLETVSRLFSRFQRKGLIEVQGRKVKAVVVPPALPALEVNRWLLGAYS